MGAFQSKTVQTVTVTSVAAIVLYLLWKRNSNTKSIKPREKKKSKRSSLDDQFNVQRKEEGRLNKDNVHPTIEVSVQPELSVSLRDHHEHDLNTLPPNDEYRQLNVSSSNEVEDESEPPKEYESRPPQEYESRPPQEYESRPSGNVSSRSVLKEGSNTSIEIEEYQSKVDSNYREDELVISAGNEGIDDEYHRSLKLDTNSTEARLLSVDLNQEYDGKLQKVDVNAHEYESGQNFNEVKTSPSGNNDSVTIPSEEYVNHENFSNEKGDTTIVTPIEYVKPNEGIIGETNSVELPEEITYSIDASPSRDKRNRLSKSDFKTSNESRNLENQDIYPRLIRVSFQGKMTTSYKNQLTTTLMPLTYKSLNTKDMFILDNGTVVYQWGQKSSLAEKSTATNLAKAMAESTVQRIDDLYNTFDSEVADFWRLLGVSGEYPRDISDDDSAPGYLPSLFIVKSKEEDKFHLVGQGNQLNTSLLNSNCVMMLDTGFELHFWEGKLANKSDRRYAANSAVQDYVDRFDRPPRMKITKIVEGGEDPMFNLYITQYKSSDSTKLKKTKSN